MEGQDQRYVMLSLGCGSLGGGDGPEKTVLRVPRRLLGLPHEVRPPDLPLCLRANVQ